MPFDPFVIEGLLNKLFLQVHIFASFAIKRLSLSVFAAQKLFVRNAFMMLNLLLSKGTKDFVVTAQNLHF